MLTTGKRAVAGVVGAGMALALAACGSSGPASVAGSTTSKSPYTVGVMMDTTGSAAATGTAGLEGTKFYVHQLDAEGGVDGHPVKMDVCDSLSTPTGGASCASTLSGVATHLVLSNSELGTSLAAVSTFSGHDVFLSPVSPLVTKAGTTTFVVNESIGATLTPFAAGMQQRHLTRLGVLATSDATGQHLESALQAIAPPYGLQLTTVSAATSATDDTPQLQQLHGAGVQAVFVAALGAPVQTVLQGAATLGMTVPFVIPGGAVTNQLLQSLAGRIPSHLYGLGNIVVSGGSGPAAARWAAYRKAFQAFARQPVDENTALAYYQGCVAKALLGHFGAGGTATAMAGYLRSHPVPCLGSTIHFDNPSLNVASGLPNELLQAGRTASDGWGAVRQPL